MDEQKMHKDRKRKNELLETVAALNSMLPRYMDDYTYKEKSKIKTDWLNKKMR